MRQFLLFAFLLLSTLFSACKKQDVKLNTTEYQAILLPSNEVPARASEAYGSAIGNYNADTKIITLRINYYSLRANLVAWHIHKGQPGANGPVIHNFGAPAASDFVFISAPLTADQENDLLTGNYYVNLHSTLYPGGEIRGQLLKR